MIDEAKPICDCQERHLITQIALTDPNTKLTQGTNLITVLFSLKPVSLSIWIEGLWNCAITTNHRRNNRLVFSMLTERERQAPFKDIHGVALCYSHKK